MDGITNSDLVVAFAERRKLKDWRGCPTPMCKFHNPSRQFLTVQRGYVRRDNPDNPAHNPK